MTPATAASHIVVSLDQRRAIGRVSRAGAGAPSPASLAFAGFAALHNNCASALGAIGQAALGPFSNSGSCDYDCGFMEQTWSWSANYSPYKDSSLTPATQRMDAGGAFATAFAPVTSWRTAALPEHGARIGSDLTAIGQIDAAIVQAGGSETPAQAQALAAAFSDAVGQVDGNLGQANAALQGLAAFLSQQSAAVGMLPALNQRCQKSADSDIAATSSNLVNDLHCGGGTAQDQFNAMQTVVDASFQALVAPFAAVDSQFRTALSAASALTGVFLIVQSKSELVTEQIQAALAQPPSSPLRTMHLNIASDGWNTLVQYANANLTPG
jgi:hypothetical protein